MAIVDPNFEAWATGVGMVTLTWAHAENILALTIAIIDEHTGPLAGYNGLPRALNKRVAYLRKALNSRPILKPLAEEGRLLAESFMALKDGRHYLVHGASAQVYGGTFSFLRVVIEERTHSTFEHKVTLREVALLQQQIIGLTDRSAAFGIKVANLFAA